jgi:hypothetical protein
LEAQREAVLRYLNGCQWKLVAEYVEVEKRNSRPQLQAAISHAKATGAKLVIARLDRLARNLHFVSSLQERGVDFVAADMPDANRLTIHIIAAVAESVGRTISENTRMALAAAKARGVKLGNPNGARALRGKQVGNADAAAGYQIVISVTVCPWTDGICCPRAANKGRQTMSKQDEKLEQKSPAKSEIKCSGALHDTDLEKVTGGIGGIEWTYTKQKPD